MAGGVNPMNPMARGQAGGVNPNHVSFSELVARSDAFPVRFPTASNRIASIASRAGPAGEARVRRVVEEDAAATRVIVHSAVWELLGRFLEHTRRHGSEEERELYQGMDRKGLVSRLMTQRPLAFIGSADLTRLRDGVNLEANSTRIWDAVGTRKHITTRGSTTTGGGVSSSRGLIPHFCGGSSSHHADAREEGDESPPSFLALRDYLSYDEMQVSALLGASTPTFFINTGSRYNCARSAQQGTFEPHGVYLGLVGARFERPQRMEDEWICVRSGMGKDGGGKLPLRQVETEEARRSRERMWMSVLGAPEEYWEQVVVPVLEKGRSLREKPGRGREKEAGGGGEKEAVGVREKEAGGGREEGESVHEDFAKMRDGQVFFNVRLYKGRMRITAEVMLLEANMRAEAAGKQAYLHVVGLGLGVWELHPLQTEWYLETFAEAIENLRLPHIHTVDFSWFKGHHSCGRYASGSLTDCRNGNRIRILISQRDPAEPLLGKNATAANEGNEGGGLLLVATYAWDGNAYPGNEYWVGSLSGSGDPAAVCCSTIGELQNPLINHFTRNMAILGASDDGNPMVSYPS